MTEFGTILKILKRLVIENKAKKEIDACLILLGLRHNDLPAVINYLKGRNYGKLDRHI